MESNTGTPFSFSKGAILAASLLKDMGYPQVYVLDGGVRGWAKQGFPMETGEPYEVDYGQPSWLARLLLGLPAGVQPRELPIPGLKEATTQVNFIAPEALQKIVTTSEYSTLFDLRSAGDFATAHLPGARWLSRSWLDLQINNHVPDRGTPVPEVLLHRGVWVADAVYSPLWTPLLIAAKAKGAEVMTGRDLAIYQAADAFELFTGLKPSIVEMGNAFDAVMAKREAAVDAA